MSNGQQLEMVDGCLNEIREATIQLDEGATVGHRILDYEQSRRVARSRKAAPEHVAGPQVTESYSNSSTVGPPPGASTATRAGPRVDDRSKESTQEERARRQQIQLREEQLNQQAQSLSERDKAVNGKQQQLAQQQHGLRAQEENLQRQKVRLQDEQKALEKKSSALREKEQELAQREARLSRMSIDLTKQRDQLKAQDEKLKEREEALRQMQAAQQANGASASSTVRQVRDNGSSKDEVLDAMDNIEAGRIRFSELTLGSLLGSGSFADVYRAEWRMACAVKKMKGRISKEQMTEFVREGEMMRSLKHPGIVKLLGVCVENGSFYLVQEIVNGRHLRPA